MSSKQNDRHIIWSDIHLDFEDWRADLEEQYPDLSEDELIQKMYEINSDYLGDERIFPPYTEKLLPTAWHI